MTFSQLRSLMKVKYAEVTPTLQVLQDDVESAEAALANTPVDSSQRGSFLMNIAVTLHETFVATGETHTSPLKRGIDLAREALPYFPVGHDDRVGVLKRIGGWNFLVAKTDEDLPRLDQVISYRIQVLDITPKDHPLRGEILRILAFCYYKRCEMANDEGALDQSIHLEKELLEFHSQVGNDRANCIENICTSFWEKGWSYGHTEAIHEGVVLRKELLLFYSKENKKHMQSLLGLGTSFWAIGQQTKDPAAFDMGIGYCREALQLLDLHPTNRLKCLNHLGSLLHARGMCAHSDYEVLDEAIAVREQALDPRPQEDEEYITALRNLGLSLVERFMATKDSDLLDRAIAYEEQALKILPLEHQSRSHALADLGRSYIERYKELGDIAQLYASIKCQRDIVKLVPLGHTSRPSVLRELSNRLCNVPNNRQAIDESILLERELLHLCSTKAGDSRLNALSELCRALHIKAHRFGDEDAMRESITLTRSSLELAPPGHPERPSLLRKLTGWCNILSMQANDLEAFKLCIGYAQERLELCPPSPEYRPGELQNIASYFHNAYRHVDFKLDQEIMDTVVRIEEECVSLLLAGSAEHVVALKNLANSLKQRADICDDLASLRSAIVYERDILSLCPPGHDQRVEALRALSASLLVLSNQTQDLPPLHETFSLLEEASQLLSDDHTDKADTVEKLIEAKHQLVILSKDVPTPAV